MLFANKLLLSRNRAKRRADKKYLIVNQNRRKFRYKPNLPTPSHSKHNYSSKNNNGYQNRRHPCQKINKFPQIVHPQKINKVIKNSILPLKNSKNLWAKERKGTKPLSNRNKKKKNRQPNNSWGKERPLSKKYINFAHPKNKKLLMTSSSTSKSAK